MIKHVALSLFTWGVLFALRVPMIILGWFIVPVALLYRKEQKHDRQLSDFPWKNIQLPKWVYPWGNTRDGCMGDIRGKYWTKDHPWFARTDYLKMYWWLAFRNPCNNFSRYMPPNAVDVNTLDLELLAGDRDVHKDTKTRWQFILGKGTINWYGFWMIVPFLKGHLDIRAGHKIKYSHKFNPVQDQQKAIKGFTIRINYDT